MGLVAFTVAVNVRFLPLLRVTILALDPAIAASCAADKVLVRQTLPDRLSRYFEPAAFMTAMLGCFPVNLTTTRSPFTAAFGDAADAGETSLSGVAGIPAAARSPDVEQTSWREGYAVKIILGRLSRSCG